MFSMSFRTPLGVFPIDKEDVPAFVPQRGYRVTVTKSDRSPYFFEILVPVPELFEVFRTLAELLPDTVYPILERPPEPEEDQPRWPHGRFSALGHYMPRMQVLRQLTPHAFSIQNDGMLGVGIAGRFDNNHFREAFIDEHKTLRFISERANVVEEILAENGIPHDPNLILISERPHAHRSLIAFNELKDMFPERELAYDMLFADLARAFGMQPKHPASL
jgi:hypothetical protein